MVRRVKWDKLHRGLAIAAANLRGQKGMSERAIYESFRAQLKPSVRPTYRDLRATFRDYEATHGKIRGESGRAYKLARDGSVRLTRRNSEYRANLKANRKFDGPQPKGKRGPFTERLDRQNSIAALIGMRISPSLLQQEDAYRTWEREVAETGGYQSTPPF